MDIGVDENPTKLLEAARANRGSFWTKRGVNETRVERSDNVLLLGFIHVLLLGYSFYFYLLSFCPNNSKTKLQKQFGPHETTNGTDEAVVLTPNFLSRVCPFSVISTSPNLW